MKSCNEKEEKRTEQNRREQNRTEHKRKGKSRRDKECFGRKKIIILEYWSIFSSETVSFTVLYCTVLCRTVLYCIVSGMIQIQLI